MVHIKTLPYQNFGGSILDESDSGEIVLSAKSKGKLLEALVEAINEDTIDTENNKLAIIED